MFSKFRRNSTATGSPNLATATNPSHSTQSGFASPASTSLNELVALRSQAQALKRNSKRKSSAPQSGAAVSHRLGRGLDFAEVREYQAGDDVRMIDWKVTARSGKAHTKLFIEERERPVIVVVDFRSHMRFGTRGMFKSVLAARLAALMGWSAVANNDRVGGFVFTDDWHTEVRPRPGRRGLFSLFNAIDQAQMHAPAGNQSPLAESFTRLRHSTHAGSTVVLLSDFIGFDDAAKSALGSLRGRLDIRAVHIADPLEMLLPDAGEYRLSAMQNNAVQKLSIDTRSRSGVANYQARFAQRQQDVADFFSSHRNWHMLACTDQPLLDTAATLINRSGTKVLTTLQSQVQPDDG